MAILTTEPLDTGLNNQKICIVGIFALAEARAARVALRPTLVDYAPARRRPIRELALSTLFDRDALRMAAGDRWSEDSADESVPMRACFAAGNRALAQAPADSIAARIMRGLTAAPALRDTAAAIGEWLEARAGGRRDRTVALQLRIERDWVAYLARRETARPDPVSRAMTNPAAILDKIRTTPRLAHTSTIYACCDESDLAHELPELKRLAAARDFDLVFKSEVPATISLPDATVAKALIDFTMCQSMPVYVGLTRSTFSNALLQLNGWAGGAQRHYRYDSDHVVLRIRP